MENESFGGSWQSCEVGADGKLFKAAVSERAKHLTPMTSEKWPSLYLPVSNLRLLTWNYTGKGTMGNVVSSPRQSKQGIGSDSGGGVCQIDHRQSSIVTNCSLKST